MSKSKLRVLMLAGGPVLVAAAFLAVWYAGDDAIGLGGGPEEESPPLPPSMPEPPGKPEFMETPTPDHYEPPSESLCAQSPDLCATARALATSLGGGAGALSGWLAPAPIVCPEKETPASPLPLCAGAGGQTRVGLTIMSKRRAFVDGKAFLEWMALLSGETTGALPRAVLVSVGCEMPKGGGPPSCDREAAASILLERQDGQKPLLILILRADLTTGRFGIVGGVSANAEGAVVAGGPARRLLPGQPGWPAPNDAGDYYFEPVR